MEHAIRTYYEYLTDELDIPLVFANTAKEQKESHLRLKALPIRPRALGLADTTEYRCLLQINIFIKHGVGELEAYRVLDKIKEVLPRTIKINGVQVIEPTEARPGFIDGSWYVVPTQTMLHWIEV